MSKILYDGMEVVAIFRIAEEVARCGGVYSVVDLSVVSIFHLINEFTFNEKLDPPDVTMEALSIATPLVFSNFFV